MVPKALGQVESVKIVSYSWYIDMLDYLTVVGEVQNVGTNTVEIVILTGTVTATDGTQVSSYAQAYVACLVPQQKAPFYMELAPSGTSSWSTGVANVNIQVYAAEATTNYQYPDVAVIQEKASIGSSSDDKGVYWVNGEIKNTGTHTATNVRVIGTFYNSSGAVVAVGGYIGSEVVAASLPPSTTATFKFGAFDLNQTGIASDKKITAYALLVQVDEPVLQGTAPSIAPTTPPTPVTSSGSSSLPTEWIYAIVVIVAVAVVAATLLLVKRRKVPNTAALSLQVSTGRRVSEFKYFFSTLVVYEFQTSNWFTPKCRQTILKKCS
jgi:hypothetical protein